MLQKLIGGEKVFLQTFCGVGGNRTLVQTSDTTDFYKFSFHFIFEYRLTENCLSISYLL